MVFCIIGLVIFGVLGLFSAKYRRYFREAMHCMKRQLMLKPCDTSFDQEMKAKISASISLKSPSLARFVLRRFALLSWIFLILMIFSIAAIGYGAYSFLAFGNCNGPGSSDFCIFGAQLPGSEIRAVGPDDDPTLGDLNAPVKIIEVGCFSCPYTKDAESIRGQILEKYGGNVSFTFRSMPLPKHELSRETAEAADCALEQGKYWEYHDKLFEYQGEMSSGKITEIAGEIGLNQTQFDECLVSGRYKEEVQKDYEDAVAAGIYATPTYFVNGKPFVGLRAFADFEDIVVGEITGSCPA